VDYDEFAIDAFGFVVGAVLANAIVIAAVVSAILFLVFVREKSLYRAMHYFFVLFFLVVAVDTPLTTLVVMAAQKNRAQWRMADLSVRRLELIVLSGGNVVDTRAVASGDAGIVEGYLSKFVVATVANRKNFEAEVKALDIPTVMKPERLAARGGLRAARARLAKAHALVAKYRALVDTQIAETRHAIETAPIATPDRRRVEEDFDIGVTRGALASERAWQLEEALLADLDREVTLLEGSRERWFLNNGRFTFLSRADLAAYNANVRELNALQVALRDEDEVLRQRAIADVVSGMPSETAPTN
jgi:hypothetical protein